MSDNDEIKMPESLDILMTADSDMKTAIPSIGKLNIIKLILEDNECIYIATDLEKEHAIETYEGKVLTKFGYTTGRVCPVVLKERGEWLNYDKIGGKATVYTLLSNPYLARHNVRIDMVDADITEEELMTAMLAYDYSQALEYRDKYLLERQLRIQAQISAKNAIGNVQYGASEMASKIDELTSAGLDELAKQLDSKAFGLSDIEGIKKWIMDNKLLAGMIIFGIIFFVITFFGGGGAG